MSLKLVASAAFYEWLKSGLVENVDRIIIKEEKLKKNCAESLSDFAFVCPLAHPSSFLFAWRLELQSTCQYLNG